MPLSTRAKTTISLGPLITKTTILMAHTSPYLSYLPTSILRSVVFLITLLLFSACNTQKDVVEVVVEVQTEDPVEFTILQINDVYEIAPLEGGSVGGLARVAGLLRQLEVENPNTIAVLAGDFLSPSFMGTLKKDGERIAGLQMVETLNAMGLDYATFGNHEFDLKTGELVEKRLDQSEFEYMSVNAQFVEADQTKRAFRQNGKDVPPYSIYEMNANDRTYKLAIVGVVLPFTKQDYLAYKDVESSFREGVIQARAEADIVIGLTHLNVDQDEALAAAVPGLPLFIGGHEHHHLSRYVGETAITKADANAKTVYVHHITYYPGSKLCRVVSDLIPITDQTPEDPTTAAVVQTWQDELGSLIRDMGYDPDAVLTTIDYTLVGTESQTRSSQTNYGQLTNKAVAKAWPGADVYAFNSGSLRLDDNLTGAITSYDVLRSFPYGGPVVRMTLSGQQLQQFLDTGDTNNFGEGGYFQRYQAEKDADGWLIKGKPLDESAKYVVVLPEFVAQGGEANLEFLGQITYDKLDEFTDGSAKVRNDMRDLVIHYMKTMPQPAAKTPARE